MIVDIPSNNFPFQLSVTIESKKPVFIRMVSYDPNKPATRYGDIVGKVDGKKNIHNAISYFTKKIKIENI